MKAATANQALLIAHSTAAYSIGTRAMRPLRWFCCFFLNWAQEDWKKEGKKKKEDTRQIAGWWVMHRASMPAPLAFQTPSSCLSALHCSANVVAAPSPYQPQHSLTSMGAGRTQSRAALQYHTHHKFFKPIQIFLKSFKTSALKLKLMNHFNFASRVRKALQWIWFLKEKELCIMIPMLT